MQTDPTVTAALLAAIVASGKTASAIAEGSGISQPQISRFLRGERTLSGTAIDRVAAYLGLQLIQKKTPKKSVI